MVPIGAIIVLGSLYLFFMYAIVKAQLVMRRRSQRVREPRLAASRSATEPVRSTG